METCMEGNLPGVFPVYYNQKSLMNIIAFSETRKRFRITADTEKRKRNHGLVKVK